MSPARPPRQFFTRNVLARAAIGASALLVAGQMASVSTASAELSPGATFVDLGSAATYSVLAGTGVANTGAGTVLAGDLGLSPSGAITGFPLGTVKGTIHDKDPAAQAAQADRAAAYTDAAGQVSTSTFSGDQANVEFHPGVHTSVTAFSNTGTMTLDADGDSSAVFIFQIGAAFSPAASSKVVLTGGALANNVFWQVSGAVSFGAGAEYVGTFLGAGAITLGDGASIKGRALTPGTVTVTNGPFIEPIDDLTDPVVSIDGGVMRSTNDTTPPISGTTDEPAGKTVSVAVDGQTLKATVRAGGVWSVSANALTSGPHDVVASIADASQNVGTATQVLTVDVTAPAVVINGGARTATRDTSPSISGTTDAPAGSLVTVTVGGQTLTATVDAAATWSVDAATVAEAPHSVVASVEDAAENTGTAHQILTVDVTVPVIAIDGGSSRSTVDTSPWIYGTTAEQAGRLVQVSVGGQDLTATVLTGGTWGVSATTLPSGPHDVVASISDDAQNTGTATQTLTIGPSQPPTSYQPDAAIRTPKGSFVGTGIYGSDQRVTRRLRGSALTASFQVLVTNRGNAADHLKLRGTPRSRAFKVTYLTGGQDVTSAVTAGTYRTNSLAVGESAQLAIKVVRTRAAGRGATRTFEVRAVSAHARTAWDAVGGVVRVTS